DALPISLDAARNLRLKAKCHCDVGQRPERADGDGLSFVACSEQAINEELDGPLRFDLLCRLREHAGSEPGFAVKLAANWRAHQRAMAPGVDRNVRPCPE